MPHEKGNAELTTILKLMSNLNEKISAADNTTLPKADYDALVYEFMHLDNNIFNRNSITLDSNNRLDHLVDVMTSIGDLDFSKQAVVNDEYSHLDYIAVSLNLMKEHLQEKIDSLKRISDVFDCFNDIYIITNEEGRITSINDSAIEQLGISKADFKNIPIKLFFDSYQIRSKYSIDFTNSIMNNYVFPLGPSFANFPLIFRNLKP